MVLGMVPIIRFGVWNIGAILIFLVAFRHVGFPLFAKLGLGQALDTNLDQPMASFTAVTVGVFAYFLAFMLVNNLNVGLPLLRPVTTPNLLRRPLVPCLFGGILPPTWNLHCGSMCKQTLGTYPVSFYVFLHLAFIAAAASALLKSDGRRLLDGWTLTVLVAEVTFAFVRNARTPIIESVLALAIVRCCFSWTISPKNKLQ